MARKGINVKREVKKIKSIAKNVGKGRVGGSIKGKTSTKKLERSVKKAGKAVYKKTIGKLEKNAQAWEKTRQRARGYVQEMQEQGFYIDTETAKLLNYKGPERMTKKRLDTLRKQVNKTQLKRRAKWGIEEWEKVIYSTDIDAQGNPVKDPYGRTIVSRQISTSTERGGLDVQAESDISYDLIEKINKDPAKNQKELANILNGLIGYQKNHFMTTEDLLAGKIWDLAIQLNGGQIPTPGTKNQYFEVAKTFDEEHYKKDANGNFIPYDPNDLSKGYETQIFKSSYAISKDPEMQEYMRFAFFRSVRFKTIPGQYVGEIMDIAKHPQTSEELYKQFRESSSLRTFNAHYNKLVNQLAQQNSMPVQAAGALLWVMLTSQIWNVAGREYLPSDQFTQNWRHIYYDLSQLEGINADRKTEKAIDDLLSDIMSETTDTADISKRVEQILINNGKTYKSLGRIY